jgi:hypothetical protein
MLREIPAGFAANRREAGKMTTKEAIVKAVEDMPEEYLDDLAHYVEKLQHKSVRRLAPTTLASEAALAKDWLRPEEDEAWRDL